MINWTLHCLKETKEVLIMSMLLLANVILKRRCVRTSCLQWMPELQWIRCSLKSKVKNFKCELNLFYFKIQSKYTYVLYYKCYFLSFFFLFFSYCKIMNKLEIMNNLKMINHPLSWFYWRILYVLYELNPNDKRKWLKV